MMQKKKPQQNITIEEFARKSDELFISQNGDELRRIAMQAYTKTGQRGFVRVYFQNGEPYCDYGIPKQQRMNQDMIDALANYNPRTEALIFIGSAIYTLHLAKIFSTSK